MLSIASHQGLRRDFEAASRDARRTGSNRFYAELRESLAAGHFKPDDFSFAYLFEQFVDGGRELRASYDPRYGGAGVPLMEASGPVNTGNFANITGQIVYTAVLAAFENPALIGDQLCTTIPTNFDGEKIPGIGRIGDMAESIGEGQPYPTAGFSEEWVETPSTIKRGMKIGITKEAIFFDRTGLILARAAEVGDFIAVNKEKRQLDMALGITTSYRRNGAAAIATYGDTPFDNLSASTALVDWTSIQAALLLFDALSDPNMGEPIVSVPDTIVVPTALIMTADRILRATNIRYGAPGLTTATTLTDAPNPVRPYTVLSNPYVSLRTSSASTWFMGNFKKAFAYMENWPIKVEQASPNSQLEFDNDIVAQWKASERGAAAVREPRYVVKATA